MGNDGRSFLRWRRGLCLGLLLRQLARMPHDKAQGLVHEAPVTVLDLALPEHAVPRPAAGRLVLRPPRLLYPEG
jgi:hypothetical protein